MRRVSWMAVGLLVTALLVSGCGRVRVPGRNEFGGKTAVTTVTKPPTNPVPKQPWFEAGPPEAKVRILAFFPMDDYRKPVLDLLKELARQYHGKVYVKCTDIRTPEGQQARQRAGGIGTGLLIDGQGTMTIQAKPNPYSRDFNQDMGTFWTSDDLKAAVAQEVARVYGK
jgi:hypothetical protein